MPCLQWGMTARILSIGTALPDTRVEQSALRDLFAAQPGFDRKSQRLVGAAFDAAAIDTRHVVLPRAAHLLNVERAVDVNELLVGHLAS